MELADWQGARVDPATSQSTRPAESAPPPAPDPEEWTGVTLPGSPAPFAGADAVAYRTTFLDPRSGQRETDESSGTSVTDEAGATGATDATDATGADRALVELQGVYARARAWLNGEYLGDHDISFAPAEFAVEPRAANELVVLCRSPAGRFGGALDTALVAPEDSVPAIRWSASVEPVPATRIVDLSLRSHQTVGESWIDATVTVEAGRDIEDRLLLSLSSAGFDGGSAMTQVGVSATAGERVTVAGRLPVRDPERWWPRGFGEQHRYTVTASLGASEATATTGFASVEYGEDGLLVNDTRVPIRGIETLPAHPRSDPTAVVESALAANATLLRPHAHVPPPAVYEACEEAGILVWQPLPYCAGAFDVERGREVARRLGERYGHRPSLAAFGMFDAPEQFFTERETDQSASSEATLSMRGVMARAEQERSSVEPAPTRGWRVRRTLGDLTHGAATAAVIGALPDWRPVVATPGLPGNATRYPAWAREPTESTPADQRTSPEPHPPAPPHMRDGADESSGPDEPDEPAVSNIPDESATRTDAEPAKRADPVSWVLDGHGHLADVPVLTRCELPATGNPARSEPATEPLATVIEGLRRSDLDLLTAFAVGDTGWPEAETAAPGSSEIVDALATAFEPVQAFLEDREDGPARVVMVNDTPEPIAGSLEWTADTARGTLAVELDGYSRSSVGTINVPASAERVELKLELDGRTVVNQYHR